MRVKIEYAKYLVWLLVFIPMFIFRDYTPDNELRYLSIADDAIMNGNLFTFYNDGVPYADKPPLYLWIVMLSRILWGEHCMLWLGLFSVIPGFVILWIMDKWVSRELSPSQRNTAQLMLLTTVYFVGTMVVLRMDILMTMFIVLALYNFYSFYKGQSKNYWWLSPLLIFLALFTKGPYGIMIPVASIFIFLLIEGQFKLMKKYLGWKFWSILIGLSLLWFGAVYIEGGKQYLNDLLFNQTVNRAIDSFSHKRGIFYYLETIWYSAAPWFFLCFGVFIAAMRHRLLQTKLEKFFATISLVTLIMLSCISSKLQVYLVPAYPFFMYLCVLLMSKMKEHFWMRLMAVIPAIIFVAVLPALFILPHIVATPIQIDSIFIYAAGGILTLGGGISFYKLMGKKQLWQGINITCIALLAAIFVGSFAIPDFNSEIGYRNISQKGYEVAREHQIDEYYSYRVSRSSGMKVYLGERVTTIPREDIEQLMALENVIVFMRNKDIAKDSSLQELIENKERHIEGPYSVIVW